ncbi:hypothetical protein CZ774_05645 [Frigoribacterium sp. JB110]|nr:hypothetical protein CZ774_05645 [Frigoribacterium sp. JB110]
MRSRRHQGGHRYGAAAHRFPERGVDLRCAESARSVGFCQAPGAAVVRPRFAGLCSSLDSAACPVGGTGGPSALGTPACAWRRSLCRTATSRTRLMGP